MAKINLTESELNAIIESSVRKVLEEGLFKNIAAGAKALTKGVQGQQLLNRGTDNFSQRYSNKDLTQIANPMSPNPEPLAQQQAEKAYNMYRYYQAEANKYLNLLNKLTKQYNLKYMGTGKRDTNNEYGTSGVHYDNKSSRQIVPNRYGFK